MPLDLLDTLRDLVSIPSVNPMGREVSGPEFYEHRLTDYLEQLFQRLGLPYQRQRVEPQRENIVARLDGDPSYGDAPPVILFEAHQDTVPVDGMTIEPWMPTLHEGRVYGRGACDIKGGMTAMLVALSRLAEQRPAGMPTVLMACTINEEHGYSGAIALVRLWETENRSLLSRRPDAAVVAEPTELNVVVAHKGAVRWRIHTKGRAGHSSEPNPGGNAIYKMAQVLDALQSYQRDVLPTQSRHSLCGEATLSVGTVRGGLSVNTVPDDCVIEVDRRLLPGEDSRRAYQDVIDFVASRVSESLKLEHEPPFLEGATLTDTENSTLAARLTDAAREVHAGSQQIGVSFGTDAATIASAGVPSVVFGPGSIDQAHTADEWVSLDQLELASEALYRFARRGL